MVEDDVQLIRRILSGDDEAFTALVHKYQKSVHALAWRRVGDFHFAEEITQDVFLRVYKHLSKLKDPRQFSGWVYVTTNRLCNTWLKKNKPAFLSLEDVSMMEVEESSYSHYESEKREEEADEYRYELVRKFLGKLPESERTVMTLYYLGEMTAKEIGNFLGVSVNTITSRLRRARERLQQDEELLVQEMLGGVQLSESLTENIIQQVADVKLTPSSTGHPLLPWGAFSAAAVLMTLLLLGLSNHYLTRFQKPYSFEARSEPTVEIIDAPVVPDINVKPTVHNQVGRVVTTKRNIGAGGQISESVLGANAFQGLLRSAGAQWTQVTGPQGGPVSDIFATSEGTLYAFSPMTGVYRLTANTTVWMPVDIGVPIRTVRTLMAEHGNTIYMVSGDEILASSDSGETWNAFCPRPVGDAIGFIVTNGVQGSGLQTGFTMYIALQSKGIFRYTDADKQWILLNDGLINRTISAVAAIEGTVFAGTDKGLYRLNSDVWERLPVDRSKAVETLTVFEENLYVGMGSNLFTLKDLKSGLRNVDEVVHANSSSSSRIFHSTDLGGSWIDITPTDGSRFLRMPTGIRLLAMDETLLVFGSNRFRSRDRGQTWANLGFDSNLLEPSLFPIVAVDADTFYKVGILGIYRTIDAGESWHLFMDGMIGTRIIDLAAFNNRLYVHTGTDVLHSIDGGESWITIRNGNLHFNSKLVVAGNVLYAVTAAEENKLSISHLSDDNVLVPIQGVPAFEMDVQFAASKRTYLSDLTDISRRKERSKVGVLAVSGETFYAEYKNRLFKWKLGDLAWKDTGLVDTNDRLDAGVKNGFKLAVSGETVYVGKQDGKLFQSFDSGNSWKDVTPNLPLSLTYFKEIVFAGPMVYVATDKGVLASQTGTHWRVVTGEIVIDRFAVDDITVYGASDKGVYRLNVNGSCEQVSSGVPGRARSLVIDRDRLYVATEQRGMFHILLNNNYIVNN